MKRIIIFLAACGIGALLIWGITAGRKEMKMEAERDQPVNAPSRFKDGVIALDKQTRVAAGIEVTLPENGKIPASAIVWWEGKPSVYIQQTPDTYARMAIAPEGSTPITQPIVTVGAQLLLSEELRYGIDVGEEK